MSYTQPEQASIFQTLRIGVESTPGTAVTAGKLLPSLAINPGARTESRKFKAVGSKYTALNTPDREWMEADVSGAPTYDELAYVLAGALSYAAPVQQGGTAAYLWTFLTSNRSADVLKTFTIEWGADSYWQRVAYGMFTGFNLNVRRSGIEIGGAMLGQRIDYSRRFSSSSASYTLDNDATGGTFTLTYSGQTTAAIDYDATAAEVQAALEALSNIAVGEVVCAGGALPGTAVTIGFINAKADMAQTITGTFTSLTGGTGSVVAGQTGAALTSIPLIPVLPGQCDLYMADTHAGLAGATAYQRAFACNFDLSNRRGPVWRIRSSDTSFAGQVEIEPTAQGELVVASDIEGRALIGNQRAGTTKWLRLKAIGENIAGAYYYTLQIDAAIKIREYSGPADQDGVYALTLPFELVTNSDLTSGSPLECQLTNTVTTL